MRTRFSRTAQKIAALVLFADTYPPWHDLLPPSAASYQRQVLQSLGLDRQLRFRLYERTWFQRLMLQLDRWLLDSQLLYLVLRKRFFDDEVRSQIARGCRQVVVLGAGLDTLGIRIADEFPQVDVWEIDLPDLVARKRDRPESAACSKPNLHRLAGDLGCDDWREQLQTASPWDPSRLTTFVAEGLLMYLQPEAVARLFAGLPQLAPEQGIILFSHLTTDGQGRPLYGKSTGLVRLGLWLIGEPMQWGVQPVRVAEFLSHFQMRALLPADATDLYARYLGDTDLDAKPPGRPIEFMGSGRWGESTSGLSGQGLAAG